MRPHSPLVPALPETWAQVLDEVEATLRGAEAAAAQRGLAIDHFAPATASQLERTALWNQNLKHLEERMQGWPAVLQQAEKEAANADVVLKAPEEALRRWLSEVEVFGQRLAKWVAPEVS